MAARPLHVLELCAGYGGFSLGLRLVGGFRTVCYVEREAYACAVLAARMADGTLDDAPVWSDLATFDGRPWHGRVDLVTAGFPCQPWSTAGKHGGEDDHRWCWPDIARIIDEVRPGRVFLENVSLNAFRRPRSDLEALGYRVPPAVCIAAADVGAPHLRKRWWCLATDTRGEPVGDVEQRMPRGRAAGVCHEGAAIPGDAGAQGDVADTDSGRQQGQRQPESGGGEGPRRGEPHRRGAVRQQQHAEDGAVTEGPRPPQRQGIHEAGPQPGPAGGDWWAAEPDVGRVADGAPARVDRLRAIGNGVVPAVVAEAWRILT